MKEQEDSGWIKDLPAGWIDGHVAFRRLRVLLLETVGGDDPAPWHSAVNADFWGPHLGQSPDQYTLSEKLGERLIAAFQYAFVSGRLCASIYDGGAFRALPKSAFGIKSLLRHALLIGPFDLDPLWPDEWQRWTGHGWAIPSIDFDSWVASGEALSTDGLPPNLVEALPPEVTLIDRRQPSESDRIPLSEAVTWIAFGLALDSERLDRAIQWQRLCDGDLQTAQRRMEDASASLLKAGADGRVSFFGRLVESYGDRGQQTAKINPLALDDYRQVLITGHDHLYYGKGLKRWYRATNDSHLRGSERGDLFSSVTVNRAELLRHFQSPAGTPLAITVGELAQPDVDFDPLADTDVTPWWSVLQAIGWIATRSRAYVAHTAHHEALHNDEISRTIAFSQMVVYVARHNCQCVAQAMVDEVRWENCTCIGNAGRALLEAIRESLVAAIQKGGSGSRKMEFHELAGVGQRPTCVDWLHVNPQPIFSSAEVMNAFHIAALAAPADASREPARKTGRPNQRDEAIALHVERRSKGDNLANLSAEGRAVAIILAKRHESDGDWSYAPNSITRAIRDYSVVDAVK